MEQAEYYKTRLEHTINYTQQATRLIYFVSGALIAALYFVAQNGALWDFQKPTEVGILLLLALVNSIHGAILIAQGDWYRKIDKEFARSANEASVVGREGLIHVHSLFAWIHWLVAMAVVVLAVLVSISRL